MEGLGLVCAVGVRRLGLGGSALVEFDPNCRGQGPRINLTRFHGIFGPNHRLRAQIVPGKRGRGAGQPQAAGEGEKCLSLAMLR
jgi:hypothetical protein